MYLVKDKSENISLDNISISNSQDNTLFTVEGLKQYNYSEGNYSLFIDLTKVEDQYGNKGQYSHSANWVVYPTSAKVKLYPNPVLNDFTIESNVPFTWYHIISFFGKSEFYQTFPNLTYKAIIKTDDTWHKGIYLIFVYDRYDRMD